MGSALLFERRQAAIIFRKIPEHNEPPSETPRVSQVRSPLTFLLVRPGPVGFDRRDFVANSLLR